MPLTPSLSSPGVLPATYPGGDAAYQRDVLAQYVLYVESTDRLAGRRAASNSFFLGLNTGVLALFAAVLEGGGETPQWLLLPFAAGLVLCLVWWLLIAHHRTVGAAKWAVIAAFERSLPAGPFEQAEWRGILRAHERRTWWSRLSRLEQVVPVVFVLAYVAAVVAVLRR